MDLAVPAKAQGRNPFTVICYLCGREYGSQSISIHEKTCIEKWEAKQQLLPKSQRKARPQRPIVEPPLPGKTDTDSKQQYNDQAFAKYLEESRYPCSVCGRKVRKIDQVYKRSTRETFSGLQAWWIF
jgi:DNA-directed RNA polymerase subunit RPC12/RpoP